MANNNTKEQAVDRIVGAFERWEDEAVPFMFRGIEYVLTGVTDNPPEGGSGDPLYIVTLYGGPVPIVWIFAKGYNGDAARAICHYMISSVASLAVRLMPN